MQNKSAIERSQMLVLHCLTQLESCFDSTGDKTVSIEDVPLWCELFGAKESVVSVLHKLVAMQKSLQELKAREVDELPEGDVLPMSDEDWELLALCVQRWKERKDTHEPEATNEG